MGIALNFNGAGQAESASLILSEGQTPRVRWTTIGGSANCQFKIVSGGVTSYVDITDRQAATAPAVAGDVVSVVYDGQGNPKSIATGVLEATSSGAEASTSTEGLACIPFTGVDQLTLSGTATASVNGNAADNDDGTQSCLDISVPASATFANSVQVRRVINGDTIGLRLSRYGSNYNTAVPFAVFVDGRPIEVDWSAQLLPETQTAPGNFAAYRNIILGRDFGDGAHDVRLGVPCDAAVARSLRLLGWLAEEKAGYRPPQRGVSVQDLQITLNSTNKTFLGAAGNTRGLVGFYWKNLNAAAQTLQVFAATSAFTGALMTINAAAAGAAGSDGYFALPGLVPDGIQLQASAANAFQITPVGAM